jgi:hypothetical protein
MGMAPDEIVAPRENTAAYPKSSVRALAVRAWWARELPASHWKIVHVRRDAEIRTGIFQMR